LIANILFFEAIVVPNLEGSTMFPILVLVMLMVCLQTCGEYIVYNDTQMTFTQSCEKVGLLGLGWQN
jgi:hypothetical protein